MMKPEERNGGIILAIILTSVVCAFYFKRCNIDRNEVYVIGRLNRSSWSGSESGWLHYFNYTFKKKHCEAKFGSPLGRVFLADSTIYIRISSHYPNLNEPVTDIRVDRCIKMMKQPDEGWKSIPKCPE